MKEWTITIKDTGEKVIAVYGERREEQDYNPTAHWREMGSRDAALGELFRIVVDTFEQEVPDGEGQGHARGR